MWTVRCTYYAGWNKREEGTQEHWLRGLLNPDLNRGSTPRTCSPGDNLSHRAAMPPPCATLVIREEKSIIKKKEKKKSPRSTGSEHRGTTAARPPGRPSRHSTLEGADGRRPRRSAPGHGASRPRRARAGRSGARRRQPRWPRPGPRLRPPHRRSGRGGRGATQPLARKAVLCVGLSEAARQTSGHESPCNVSWGGEQPMAGEWTVVASKSRRGPRGDPKAAEREPPAQKRPCFGDRPHNVSLPQSHALACTSPARLLALLHEQRHLLCRVQWFKEGKCWCPTATHRCFSGV